MKLIIGLGNPGEKYVNNRHNIGYIIVDKLKNQNSKVKAFKTNTFMNNSGSFVKKLTTHYSLPTNGLYVVYDDLDIPLGSYKIQFGKGPKDHNGLNDIYDKLGIKDFWHVRVGIEGRIKNEELRIKGEDYVLEDFTREEREVLDKVVTEVCKRLVT